MKKKILLMIFLAGTVLVASCSNMWDDLNDSVPHVIPEANITIDGYFTDWIDVPEFLTSTSNNYAGTGNHIEYVKIATNEARSKVYLMAKTSGNLNGPYYMIILSNDYTKCDGYRFNYYFMNWDVTTPYKIELCSNISMPISMSGQGDMATSTYFEVVIDPSQLNITLNNSFTVTLHATTAVAPFSVYDPTETRWAKLR